MKQIKFFRNTSKVLVCGKTRAMKLAKLGQILVAGVPEAKTIYTNVNPDDLLKIVEERAKVDFAGVILLSAIKMSEHVLQAPIQDEGDFLTVEAEVEGEMLMITRDGRCGVFGCNGKLYSNDPEKAKAEMRNDMESGYPDPMLLMLAINLCGLEKAEVIFVGEEGE